ncbi:hypothetical protein BOX15_Mlig000302g1 [Macrostomum lignano]|uniref:inositol-polyphosphate 5-phosphatase n=2 Tax=Macrostomum lignano TaxID=282301 RepID=A0A267GTV6_9PLAT|nr:hypothetical protein BOX15_Mlig000302g1 [Macrostomum lignano]
MYSSYKAQSLAMKNLKTLLISANVGSLFDDPENLFKKWLNQFYQVVRDKDPDFIALHCQEVGGKNFAQSMPNVKKWIQDLLASPDLKSYDRVRIFLDEDFKTAETFTALGSLYFVHSRVADIRIWDFASSDFVNVKDTKVYDGSIESVGEKDKQKFPLELFPNRTWSRKGYMRTRWQVGRLSFDLVNVHLFHDDSNLESMSRTPSIYADFRRGAFNWTLDQLRNGSASIELPTFLFGDFNFRLDMVGYLRAVADGAERREQSDKSGRPSRVDFLAAGNGENGGCLLSVGKKLFERRSDNGANEFYENKNCWLNELDFELKSFDQHLFEFPVTFPPTYPFSEDCQAPGAATDYMATRLPGWCDRVLCSHSARRALLCPPDQPTQYAVLGLDDCLGDHKPVFLSTLLCTAADAEADAAGCILDPADMPSPPLLSRLLDQPGVQVKLTDRNGAVYAHVRRDGTTICVFRETAV